MAYLEPSRDHHTKPGASAVPERFAVTGASHVSPPRVQILVDWMPWRFRRHTMSVGVLSVGLSGLLLLLLAGVLLRLWRLEARHRQAVAALAASDANLHALSDNPIMGISVLRQ